MLGNTNVFIAYVHKKTIRKVNHVLTVSRHAKSFLADLFVAHLNSIVLLIKTMGEC